MTRTCTAMMTIAALVLAPAAMAQDTAGTITGAYNADDAVWTVSLGGEDGFPASGWVDRDDGLDVTLVGRTGPGEFGGQGTLVVQFTMTGQPQELRAVDPLVMMGPGGVGERMIARPENIDLMVTALERNDDDMAIAGDLVATLTPGGAGGLTIDTEDAVVIDGNFQATLTRLDGDQD